MLGRSCVSDVSGNSSTAEFSSSLHLLPPIPAPNLLHTPQVKVYHLYPQPLPYKLKFTINFMPRPLLFNLFKCFLIASISITNPFFQPGILKFISSHMAVSNEFSSDASSPVKPTHDRRLPHPRRKLNPVIKCKCGVPADFIVDPPVPHMRRSVCHEVCHGKHCNVP